MNQELRIKRILLGIFSLLFLFIIHNSSFIIHPVSAQVLQAECTNYLINGQTPVQHGPLFQNRSYNFSITMQNVGDTTWFKDITPVNPGGPFRFGAACPNDSTTWGIPGLLPLPPCGSEGFAQDSGQGSRPERVDLTRDVADGDSYTFSLSATTPTSAGTYLMVYRMVQDGVAWFGGACTPSLQVDDTLVVSPPPPPPPATGGSCPAGVGPGDACGECVAQTCPNGDQCATGHTYCVFDPNGNFCGSCQREVDNCATQCVTPGGPFDVGVGPAGIPQLEAIFINIVYAGVALGFIAMFAFLAWSGFKYLTSGGEPKAVFAAHQTVTWALLGVIFLAIAWLVLQLISAFTGINLTIFNLRTLIQ